MNQIADAREFNFDGIVGPTHNYAGLSHGNVASAKHKDLVSNPKAAALEGLNKMKFVADMGIGQAVLPPHFRPRIKLLHQLGFRGSPEQMIASAAKQDPAILAACYSASSMWTANAATVSPSADTDDKKVHLTPANLVTLLHRSIEGLATMRTLRSIFSAANHFEVHDPLAPCSSTPDEGAANHTRLCANHGGPGIEMFVFGKSAFNKSLPSPKKYPARQTLESCEAIARLHQLPKSQTLFVQQNPEAIDAGVFHNDVISVGNQNVLLCHELAFVDQKNTLNKTKEVFRQVCGEELHVIEFTQDELQMPDAVASYLFNSQLLSKQSGNAALVCPIECSEIEAAKRCLDRIVSEDNPVDQVEFMNLRQSMNNGGGPACLRLRVVLTQEQQNAVHSGVIFTDELHSQLSQWVQTHYRDELAPSDLADPKLVDETYTAFEALSQILRLPLDVLVDQ